MQGQQFLELRQKQARLFCVVAVPGKFSHALPLASNVALAFRNMPLGLRQVVKQHRSGASPLTQRK
jgi:hypothetical protein